MGSPNQSMKQIPHINISILPTESSLGIQHKHGGLWIHRMIMAMDKRTTMSNFKGSE